MTMLRYNEGKLPLSLIPTSFFEAIFNTAYEIGISPPTQLIRLVGAVLDFGAKKYAAHNWRKGGSWASVLNSGLRHLLLMIEGEENDPESGLSHAGHLGCNIAFLLEFAHTQSGDDDRHKVALDLGLDADAEPSLIWVLDPLLRFRDGGSIDDLREAAWELARYVEFTDREAEPEAESGAPDFMTLPFVLQTIPPFGFPLNNVSTH